MKATKINPQFDDLAKAETFTNHIQELTETKATPHSEILDKLKGEIVPIDFKELAYSDAIARTREKIRVLNNLLQTTERDNEEIKKNIQVLQKGIEGLKPKQKHYLVSSVENLIEVAKSNRWGLCKNHDFIYLYNGTYWQELDNEEFQKFLGEVSEKMGVEKFDARFHKFREHLYKQFLATAYLPTPENNKNTVLINLQNGTFEISPQSTKLRPFDRSDFLTYQLPFEYNPQAKAPLFEAYLNKVLPDKERQKVLAEYLGYVFIKHGGRLKLEAALVLYGTGANGKSVFFEIVNALLGANNVSSYSLQELTDDTGYYRAMIANKLVNYASEINGKLQTDSFKRMVSGEVMPARLPYGKPMQLTNYAKFIFNCNELPKDVEHTNAYFRRWLIIPFDVTIPKAEQDSELHTKIIENELSGVFNWVLEGLNRLLDQKKFSDCEAVQEAVEQYKSQSDSVKMFIDENNYQKSPTDYKLIKDLYPEYRAYCIEDGFKPVNKSNFIKRLSGFGVLVDRLNIGNVAYLSNGIRPF